MLRKDVAEVLHRPQELRRIEFLIPNDQNPVVGKGLVQALPGGFVQGLADIQSDNRSTRVRRERLDRKRIACLLHGFLASLFGAKSTGGHPATKE